MLTFRRHAAIWAVVILAASTALVRAQWGPSSGCSSCSVPQAARVAMQPVVQQCYQTVPVTQYQPVTRTIQKPVPYTEYVEQPVTEYVPVTEQRVSAVPSVQYQNVTEYRTVQRDRGRWVTRYSPVPRTGPRGPEPQESAADPEPWPTNPRSLAG